MKIFAFLPIYVFSTFMIEQFWGMRKKFRLSVERFVIIVNSFQALTIITKRSILDVAAVLDPPLVCSVLYYNEFTRHR